MNCPECERIKSKKYTLYEDQYVVAMFADKPAANGHIIVLPKEHQPIVEKVSDEVFAHMVELANKLAIVCFETLGAEGTNLLVQNGVPAGQKSPHAQLHVLPRYENDGLNLQWNSIKLTEDDLSTTHLMLKTELEPKVEKKIEVLKEEPKQEMISDEGENYMLMQLERTP